MIDKEARMSYSRVALCAAIVCIALSFPGQSGAQNSKFVLLSSTIGPIDAGIVDALETAFEKDTGIRVRHVFKEDRYEKC
jgi:ABC-type tungstate transport system permease subunit